MRILFSPDMVKELKKIKRNHLKLSKKVEKKLSLFQNNPQHISLRTHKLQGNLKNMWSISITEKIRMIYLLLSRQEAYFIAIGTHDEVYKKWYYMCGSPAVVASVTEFLKNQGIPHGQIFFEKF